MSVTIRNEDAPGTYIAERDESQASSFPASTRGVAVVGYFEKGYANSRIRLRSQNDLINIFGSPDTQKYGYSWWVAYEALMESDEVYVVRVVNNVPNPVDTNPIDKLKYAAAVYNTTWSGSSGIDELATSSVVSHSLLPAGKGYSPDKNIALDTHSIPSDGIVVASSIPGVDGNLLGIELVGAKLTLTTTTPTWGTSPSTVLVNDLYQDTNGNLWRAVRGGLVGTSAPTFPTSPYVGMQIVDNDVVWVSTTTIRERDVLGVSAKYPEFWWKVMRLRVYRKPNPSVVNFSGLPVLDEFFFTLDESVSSGGVAMYAPRIVNGKGKGLVYISVGSDFTDGTIDMSYGVFDGSNYNTSGVIGLSGGADGVNTINHVSGISELISGWDLFAKREYSNWSLADAGVSPEMDATYSVAHKLNEVCASRMGAMCTAQVSKINDTRVENIEMTAEAAFGGLKDASYSAFYAGYDRRRDPISGKLVWIPKSIEGLRAILKASRLFNDAQAPAGAVVATCKGIEQNVEFSKTDCGYLYSKNINVSIKKPEGNVLWGQKTALRVSSKRDRINVRRILNKIAVDMEQIGDTLIWSNISPALIERLYTALDRYLEQRSGEGYFDISSKEAGKGYRIKIERNPTNKNRLDARIDVMPIDTLEWIGIELVVTDSGVESVSEQ